MQLHRNNHYYAFLINVCELIHNQLLADEQTGRIIFRDFLRDKASMARVFEAFVRNFYLLEQDINKVESLKIKRQGIPRGDAGGLEMRTDVCLSGASRKIIIDCKYYPNALQTNFGKQTVHSEHLHQLFAYLKNKEEDSG